MPIPAKEDMPQTYCEVCGKMTGYAHGGSSSLVFCEDGNHYGRLDPVTMRIRELQKLDVAATVREQEQK